MIAAPILVLIVNYRTASLTAQAIAAIADEVRARSDAQILVVDNGSADGSAEAIAKYIDSFDDADICSLLALDENLGFAGGNNAGLDHYRQIAMATGTAHWPDFVWLLNPDTIAEPDALDRLIDFMKEKPEAGIAGGLCLRPDGSVRHSAFRFHSPLNEFTAALDFGPLRHLFQRHDVAMPMRDAAFRAEWLSGAHMMIRGRVIDRIGLLDPRYFLYFEETDYCARAAAAGFEAWHVPDSRVMHIGGQSTGLTESRELDRRPLYWFTSRARFMLRRHGVFRTHLANLGWLAATPPGRLLAKLRGRPRDEPPHLWRDFLKSNYGRGGLMYRTREVMR